MQNSVTESNWEARDQIDRVVGSVNPILPKRKMIELIIDENDWVKKG